MPFVLPTVYLIKTMVPKTTHSKLKKFQFNKIISFQGIVLSNTLGSFAIANNEFSNLLVNL
tara:strand:+ start:826 stop:1008 length:183 start_codon:yes stop_codon:yes gene_type:complete